MLALSSDFIWILFGADIKLLQCHRLGGYRGVCVLKYLLENVTSRANSVKPVFASLEVLRQQRKQRLVQSKLPNPEYSRDHVQAGDACQLLCPSSPER